MSTSKSKFKSEASPGAEAWGIFFKDTRLRREASSLGSLIPEHLRLGNSETSLKKILTKTNLILLLILLVGLFLRTYQLKERFLYGHDQDLAGWIIKDIVVDKHLRLVGQETSTQGVFIGPLMYYLQIPFYLITGMDPIGGTYLFVIIGLLAIASVYFVFLRVFDKETGLVGALVYAVSFYTVFNDREVVPTVPVIFWSVWFLYTLYLILEGKQKQAYILAGVLIGLIWHLNFALVLPLPLLFFAQYLAKKRIDTKSVCYGLVSLLITSLPLILFEFRHGFLQTKAVLASITTPQSDVVYSGIDKLKRVWFLMAKNVSGLLMGSLNWLEFKTTLILMLFIFSILIYKKKISAKLGLLFSFWILVYLAFFSSYSKIVSEYYLNGTIIIWIAIFSVFISYLIKDAGLSHWGVIILSLFTVFNLFRFFTHSINESGYLQKKEIVADIKKDSKDRGYPCVAISYITDPGYELGYRYIFWLNNLHVNRYSSGSPVYTIVYPLKPIFPTDKNFGSIGLIYPDYQSYNMDEVRQSCSGENSNLTDPMFGFTK